MLCTVVIRLRITEVVVYRSTCKTSHMYIIARFCLFISNLSPCLY
uniref:Uncharacterized protein n=1 Tax=Arundo donax TaxID=35708 RepID=A0A0A9GJI5_ARUDO